MLVENKGQLRSTHNYWPDKSQSGKCCYNCFLARQCHDINYDVKRLKAFGIMSHQWHSVNNYTSSCCQTAPACGNALYASRTISAEELKSYVVIFSICVNAAFLHVPFQHVYTSEYRKNWLKKSTQSVQRLLSKTFCSVISLMQFIPSSCFYDCSVSRAQAAGVDLRCPHPPTALFAEQCVNVLQLTLFSKAIGKPSSDRNTAFLHPRWGWFRLWNLQGTAQDYTF